MIVRLTMDTFDQAKAFFLQGIAHYEAGRFEQAQRQFEASLSLVPQRASTLTNLGATHLKLGRFADAALVLEEATRLDPADAQAWGHRATALAEMGRRDDALHCADEALQRDAQLAAAWTLRGTLLRDAGRNEDAAQSFRQAIACGGDAELNGFFLAALGGGEAPAATPPRYVQALFDGYADGFESHLVQVLRYRAPEVLVQGLGDRRFDAALDLGCGTGLVGEELRPRAKRIVGVDLSRNMVERARDRGVYDEVVQADVLQFLTATRATTFDLVVAADVFIYVGRLEDVFAQVRRVLAPGGVFCFTVELGGQDVELRPSLRYAHSRAYVESLAQAGGFETVKLAEQAVREEQRAPIAGLFAWLKKP
jgi:predicted TPR repeat methyltransferase